MYNYNYHGCEQQTQKLQLKLNRSIILNCTNDISLKHLIEHNPLFLGSGGPKFILEGNLTINPVARSDAGIYTCTATNDYGTDRTSTRLSILRQYRIYWVIFIQMFRHSKSLFPKPVF